MSDIQQMQFPASAQIYFDLSSFFDQILNQVYLKKKKRPNLYPNKRCRQDDIKTILVFGHELGPAFWAAVIKRSNIQARLINSPETCLKFRISINLYSSVTAAGKGKAFQTRTNLLLQPKPSNSPVFGPKVIFIFQRRTKNSPSCSFPWLLPTRWAVRAHV